MQCASRVNGRWPWSQVCRQQWISEGNMASLAHIINLATRSGTRPLRPARRRAPPAAPRLTTWPMKSWALNYKRRSLLGWVVFTLFALGSSFPQFHFQVMYVMRQKSFLPGETVRLVALGHLWAGGSSKGQLTVWPCILIAAVSLQFDIDGAMRGKMHAKTP